MAEEREYSSLTDGRDKTMIVKIPRIVPNGMNKHRIQAITKENQYLLRRLRNRPDTMVAIAQASPNRKDIAPKAANKYPTWSGTFSDESDVIVTIPTLRWIRGNRDKKTRSPPTI